MGAGRDPLGTGKLMGGGANQERAGAGGRPGVIIKLFGAILMMLGLLDSLLSLRGGLPATEFLLLFFFGAAVFAAGAIRANASGPGRAPVAGSSESGGSIS